MGSAHLLEWHLLLHSAMSTKQRRKRAVYIFLLTRTSIRTMEHIIALTHLISSNHLITCAILSHYKQSFASHDFCFRSCEFRTNIFFACAIFSAKDYDPNLQILSHGYCSASACAPIVHGPQKLRL